MFLVALLIGPDLCTTHSVKFSVDEHKPLSAAPELGADTASVLAELGLSADELSALTKS